MKGKSRETNERLKRIKDDMLRLFHVAGSVSYIMDVDTCL